MKNIKKSLFLILILMIAVDLNSQTPIEPYRPTVPSEIGVVMGIGLNFQGGASYAECADCIFEDGNKFGYTLGIVYEDEISSNVFKWGVKLIYESLDIYSSFKEREPFEFEPGKFVPINFRHHSDIKIHSFALLPYFKWSPVDFYFLKAGPNFSMISANLLHRKEILDKTVLLPTGETTSIQFPESKSREIILEDNDYPNFDNFQLGIAFMTGFNFELGYDVVLSPYFYYNMPLTNISDFGEDFKVHNWRFMFELRMKI